MKKYLLAATIPMITFVAGAVSYLRVQKTDNNVYTYILDKVGSINYEKNFHIRPLHAYKQSIKRWC